MSEKITLRDNLQKAENTKRVTTIAVVGNPNSGKSTIINAIAGSKLKVGNWAGVTIEKKEAFMEHKGRMLRIVDLPGSYSLNAFSDDEKIISNFLLEEKPDLIIDVIDSSNLERSLYLTTQIMELGQPIIVALNMMDESNKQNLQFDLEELERQLFARVIPTVASKGENISLLLDTIVEICENIDDHKPKDLNYGDKLENARAKITSLLNENTDYLPLTSSLPLKWLVYKLLEEDKIVTSLNSKLASYTQGIISDLKNEYNNDTVSIVSLARHSLALEISKTVVNQRKPAKIGLTERVDKVVLSRFAGSLIFAFSMFLLFQVTFGLANPFIDWIDGPVTDLFLNSSLRLMNYLDLAPWLKSLFVEGIVGGVGTVMTFAPLIFFMMFFISFLEGSGYMARIAFVMDKLMQAVGLHGKSFIPMLLGFGCNVAGVYATRTLESRKDKIITALVMPLMSCSARLPVYGIIASIFFGAYAAGITFLMYFLGIIIALFMIFIFRRFLFKGEEAFFIMELPPYRMPTIKYLLINSWGKARYFIVQAGSWILAAMLIVWVLNNVPWDPSPNKNKADSLLGMIGSGVAYIATPLGFGTKLDKDGKESLHWEAGASLLTGIVAKELVVGSLGQLYGVSDTEDEKKPLGDYAYEAGSSLIDTSFLALKNLVTLGFIGSDEDDGANASYQNKLKESFTPLSSFVYMIFTLLYMPCIVTAIAYKSELGSWKWFYLSAAYSLTIAWVLSFITYRIGSLF